MWSFGGVKSCFEVQDGQNGEMGESQEEMCVVRLDESEQVTK